LEEQGLAGALEARLRAVEGRAGLASQFDCQGEGELPRQTEQELYRIAQEALNNVLKHAHASRVCVTLTMSPGLAALEIVDDGAGFDASRTNNGGQGLAGMRERANRLGGTLSVESSPGAGTRIRVEVPG
jgi:signal transduction histidine kinase